MPDRAVAAEMERESATPGSDGLSAIYRHVEGADIDRDRVRGFNPLHRIAGMDWSQWRGDLGPSRIRVF